MNNSGTLSESSKISYIEQELKIPASKIITISQLNEYIEQKLTNDPKLLDIYLIGETSNLRSFPSGHTYFDLKDKEALVSCILFKSDKMRLKYVPEDNKEILVLASVSVYKKNGRYQLIVKQVFPIGEGLFYTKFRKLKEKLKNKGMFDIKHKKEIPMLPRGIGIAASTEGSAIRDILDTLTNRFPNINIYISSTTVQGDKAPDSIINSIKILNELNEVDTIIVSRGGGSIEDLDCFNNEDVAKAIFNSEKPIISAIGHEDDWTIADFVADKRAITPTHSAELAILNKEEEISKFREMEKRLENLMENYTTKSTANVYKKLIIVMVILIIAYMVWRLFLA